MKHLSLFRILALLVSAWWSPLQASPTDCRQFYGAVDQTIVRAGVRDAQEGEVKGYPYLRSNRFLASLVNDADSAERFDFLLQQMMALEGKSRRLELSNLPAQALADLQRMQRNLFPSQADIASSLDACAQLLISADRTQLDKIKRKIRAPASYSLVKRLLGFYPLAAIPFSRGIRNFQAEMKQAYAKNISETVAAADLVLHVAKAVTPTDVGAILQNARDNPLRIPLPSREELAQLFDHFAPNFAIDTQGEFDRPGSLAWRDDGRLNLDPTSPRIYTLVSHTRFDGQTLLQLNYVIWFSERPKKGKLDMLGGALDGLIWRVTLADDGQPLLYDSIHPCGCYHVFFPSHKLRAKPRHPSLQEHAYVAQAAPQLQSGERPTIWVASATHYMLRVTGSAGARSTALYQLADYDELRSLPRADGTRQSLFGPDGLVPGSERGERVVFWPMGIASAGAMRQWGHHATAFVGMRHFDDPDLLEKAFETVR